MRSVLLQYTAGYWTLHRLLSAMLRQIETHCPQVWSTNVYLLVSNRTALQHIVDVEYQLIFSVFVSFVLFEFFYKYIIMSHCIVHMVQNNAILLQYSLDLEHFHILLSLNSFSFSPNSVFVCVCVCVCMRACVCVRACVYERIITYIVVTAGKPWWFINPFKFQMKQMPSQGHMIHIVAK